MEVFKYVRVVLFLVKTVASLSEKKTNFGVRQRSGYLHTVFMLRFLAII